MNLLVESISITTPYNCSLLRRAETLSTLSSQTLFACCLRLTKCCFERRYWTSDIPTKPQKTSRWWSVSRHVSLTAAGPRLTVCNCSCVCDACWDNQAPLATSPSPSQLRLSRRYFYTTLLLCLPLSQEGTGLIHFTARTTCSYHVQCVLLGAVCFVTLFNTTEIPAGRL